MVDYFLKRVAVPPIGMMDGVQRRTMGTTDEAMLCEFTLQQGAVVPEHSHMNDQVGYVLSGVLELTVGTRRNAWKRGTATRYRAA